MDIQLAAGIASEIVALSSHYPVKRLAPDAKARWLADYADDIVSAGWSGEDTRLACAIWRASDAKKMPSPGELLAKGGAAISGTGRHSSNLPVTVPPALHDDMCDACGGPFAGSYLSGAEVEGSILKPHTSIARDRLLDSPEAMRVIAKHGLTIAGARPRYSEEHKAEMRAKIGGLVGLIVQRNYNRMGRETEAEYAERLWPSRRIDRVYGGEAI